MNSRMRWLFPEFCSAEGKDIGSSEKFTIPCRTTQTLKEPTMSIITVTSAMAGHHFEVIKHSDVIDHINSRTAGGLDSTRSHFRMCIPLLEPGPSLSGEPLWGWRTIEGTIYSYADYHAEMLETLQRESDGEWSFTHRSCWVDSEKTQPIWPERFSRKMLERIRMEMGSELFANQYELNPIAEGAGLTTSEQLSRLFMPREKLDQLLPRLRLHVTIDLAGLEVQSTGDFTVLTLCGFDRTGRMYVIECHRGHFDGQEVINLMFDLDHRYRIIDFKIEKEAHARGLRGTLDREQSLRGRYLSITYLPRDTHTSKVDRIRYGLGYWFRAGIIRFPDDLVVRDALTDEVLRFPKWKHDDILDTLVDQTQNQNMTEPDIMAIPKDQPIEVFKLPRFTGFDINGQPTWGGKSDQTMEQFYDPTTGI
jgi:predicted phage terminase large subunit-like protein